MNKLSVSDKVFELYIQHGDILKRVKEIATELNAYKNRKPLFISVLNGSFMFTSDLMKCIDYECELSFIKLSSYSGTNRSMNTKQLMGLNENLKGRQVIIIEDIVETGNTLEYIIKEIQVRYPEKISVVSLFFKPDMYQKGFNIEHFGYKITNEFIVGYGLDYNGLGRNLKDVYKIKN